ncbi:MAG: hypothetical protein M3370_02460 [Actinomycetota bacterium]|nr:hypothetical protein [Actinomycetota bacterium]
MRRLLVATVALAALLALPSAAPAKVNIAVGIGDQHTSMFANPFWQSLNVRQTRYFIHWDAIDKPAELHKADQFVLAARNARQRVLLHISTNDLAPGKAKLPSARAYRLKVKALYNRYRPLGVRDWGVWNEANHKTQPTYRSARRAATFAKDMRKFCKDCNVVALDILDQKSKKGSKSDYDRYIREWFRWAGPAGRSKKLIIGIHNYSEVNRGRTATTGRIIREVKKHNRSAKFWYTETGGLAGFGRSFPCDPSSPSSIAAGEKRQAKAINHMFRLAKKYRRDVKRLYSYNWTGTNCTNRFDAGLVRLDGSDRPAARSFRARLREYRR